MGRVVERNIIAKHYIVFSSPPLHYIN